MKTIGILERHEIRILGSAIDYSGLNYTFLPIHGTLMDGILKYLESGIYIYGMTLAIQDSDGKYISPYIVYSDGEWMWPAYFSYYIKSGNVKTIPTEFLVHIRQNNFEVPKISLAKEQEAKNYFMALLFQNIPKYRNK
jgi:hypothetical protein